MRIEEFDYHLPPEAIAQYPAAQRDSSRLLVLDRAGGTPGHHVFRDLPSLLWPGDLLVLNRSRVLPARLLGARRGGRVVAVGTTAVRTLESAADEGRRVAAGAGETSLVIVPGYRFRVVDAMVTNFHLPRSSLLLLVCAFAGRERVLAAYAQALAGGYRFYSYGDAMLIV